MIPVRKLTFQLTPLLDLLLIVIFAQFLEVRTVAREEVTRMRSEQELLRSDYDRELDSLKQQLTGMVALQQERRSLSQEVRQLKDQRDLVGELVIELFRVPESVVAEAVPHRAELGPGPDDAEIRRLKEQLQKFGQVRGDEMVRHLLTFNELRKRCDLWELYIQADGQIVFTTNERRQIIRADNLVAFSDLLFDAYKALPQPKSLVLILVSYGDIRLNVKEAVLDGLPAALERIRMDDEGRSRFDFAVLGYRSERTTGDQP